MTPRRREPWLLLPAVALLAAYLWLLARPVVAEGRYRLYYVEGAVNAWLGGRHPRYGPGQVLDFRQRQPVLSQRGWSVAEPAGTWSSGPRAGLVLHAEPAWQPRWLVLELDPFVRAERGLDAQEMRLRLNGLALGAWRLQAAQALRVPLPPAAVIGAEGMLRFDFEFPQASSPREHGLGPDPRRLAVRLRSLRLEG